MMSLPETLHASPVIGRLSNVRRRGGPTVIGTTYTSLATPATVPRMKATCEPSGENSGLRSRYSSGGCVRIDVVEVASSKSVMLELVPTEYVRGKARVFPSGDHESPG